MAAIFTYIDPHSGGTGPKSQMTMVSIFMQHDHNTRGCKKIIARSRNHILAGIEIKQLLKDHFAKINKHPEFSNVPHYLQVDENFGGMGYADLVFDHAQAIVPNLGRMVKQQ